MSDPAHSFTTVTNTYLLEGLKDPANESIWNQYVERYRPMLKKYGKRLGLNEEDAEDVAQLTLVHFSRAYQEGKYDRERGRLRVWLFGIAHNQIRNWQRRRRGREHQVAGSGDQTDFFAAVEDEHQLETAWDEEWRSAVLAQCLAQVRTEVTEQTFRAFEMFAYEGKPAEEVGKLLNITANAVFGAKRRILRRIRELMPEIEEIW